MKRLLLLATLVCTLACNNQTDKPAKYEPNWESLSKRQAVPEWLKDAKFGIYFTWGVFSVPAYSSEWYPFHMYRQNNSVSKHHKETYGEGFEYHNFVDQFTAENFDPKEWAELFKSTGAKFAGPCAMHHDGFSMWKSEVNPWNAGDKGPKRDIMGELFSELRNNGLKTIATLHHARNLQRNANNPEQWARNGSNNCGADSHYAYDPDLITSTKDPILSKLYGNFEIEEGNKYWLDITNEVIEKYSPDILWFDSWLNMIPEEYRQQMAANYFNNAEANNQEVTIGYKQNDMPRELGIEDIEQGGKLQVDERVWMTDVTLSFGSWSYITGQTYKSADLVVRNMIDVWSKNGIVLLNVSPMANGTIPDEQRTVLKEIGDWLKRNGEAVYGTHAFKVNGFGPAKTSPGYFGGQSATTQYSADDVRYTVSKDEKSFYAIMLGKPEVGKEVYFPTLYPHNYTLPAPVKRITVLGSDIEAEYEIDQDLFKVTIPDAPMDSIATVLKFELGS